MVTESGHKIYVFHGDLNAKYLSNIQYIYTMMDSSGHFYLDVCGYVGGKTSFCDFL